MKSIVLFLISLCLFNLKTYSQIDDRNDWEQERLIHKPSVITESGYKFVEKFGETTEQQISSLQLLFNQAGYYLSRQSKEFSKYDRKETYVYQTNLRSLTNLQVYQRNYDYPSEISYSVSFEYSAGLIAKKTVEQSSATNYLKTEFEYDNQDRNIMTKSYDGSNNLIEIWEYIYSGKYLSEKKKYNNEGVLVFNSKFQYDNKGNLTQSDDYVNKKLDKSMIYNYNEKNNVIKETTINYNLYNNLSVSEQQEDFLYYKYEYYSNGLVKKSSELSHSVDRQGNRIFADATNEILEFKYDEFGNWIEKIKWGYDIINKKLMPVNKYIRKITYF